MRGSVSYHHLDLVHGPDESGAGSDDRPVGSSELDLVNCVDRCRVLQGEDRPAGFADGDPILRSHRQVLHVTHLAPWSPRRSRVVSEQEMKDIPDFRRAGRRLVRNKFKGLA